jgi:hypothetical protein
MKVDIAFPTQKRDLAMIGERYSDAGAYSHLDVLDDEEL